MKQLSDCHKANIIMRKLIGNTGDKFPFCEECEEPCAIIEMSEAEKFLRDVYKRSTVAPTTSMKQVSDCCGADVKEHSINGVDHNNNDTFGDWHECLECSKPCTPITPMSEELRKLESSKPTNRAQSAFFESDMSHYTNIHVKRAFEIGYETGYEHSESLLTSKLEEKQKQIEDGYEYVRALAESVSKKDIEIQSLKSRVEELEEALKNINDCCGTISYSSHNQMKEAIQGALELSETALNPQT